MRFEVYPSRRGKLFRKQWRWRLKAENGKKLANSGEGYSNRVDCLHAIDRIRQEAAHAPIKGGGL